MAANVSLSTLTTSGAIKYSRRTLFFAEMKMILGQFGQVPEDLDEGWTDIIYTRFIPIDQSTGMTDVTSTHTYTNSKKTRIQNVKVSPKLFTDGEDFSLFDTRRMFVNFIQGASRSYGNWMGKQFNYELTEEVSRYALHIVANLDTAYQLTGTISAVGTTTTVVDTDGTLDDTAADYWNGSFITFLTGPNKGFTASVSDDDGAGTLTIDNSNAIASALPKACTVGDRYIIASPAGLTDITACRLNSAAVARAVTWLEFNEAEGWDNMFMGYYDAANKADYIANITPTAKYTEMGIVKIFKNEVGISGGVRWVRGFELFRHTADTARTETRTTGAVSHVLIFGKDAFGEVAVKAGPNKPQIIVKTPGPYYAGVTHADGNLRGSVAVQGAHAPKLLNALYCVSIMTYPNPVE